MSNVSEWTLHPDLTEPLRFTCGVLTMFIAVLGVIGNAAICLVILHTKQLYSSSNLLIGNLATTDLLQSINMISIATTLFTGKWNYGSVGCQLSGFVVVLSVTSSTLSLALISINRFTMIQKPQVYRYYFTKWKTLYMIAIIWVIATISALPPLVGWTSFIFRQRRSLCTLDFHASRFYLITVSTVVLVVPYLVIVYCYWHIFRMVYKSRRRVTDSTISSIPNSRLISFRECMLENDMYKTSFFLFLITSLFIIVYVPTMVTNIIEIVDSSFMISPWIDMVFIILAFSNQCINPFVYGFVNKHYRKALAPCCLCKACAKK